MTPEQKIEKLKNKLVSAERDIIEWINSASFADSNNPKYHNIVGQHVVVLQILRLINDDDKGDGDAVCDHKERDQCLIF